MYFVGVDLGQSRDFTAIAAVERAEVKGAWDPCLFAWRKAVKLRLRFLERLPLGTPYPEVVERVVEVTRAPELRDRCRVAVDGTGVGRPVVDELRRAQPAGILMPAIITSGEWETKGQGYYRIPKRDLIVGLQVMLQRGVLEIAGGLRFGAELAEEMAAMQVKVTAGGHEQYGAWREGTHDDLVFAVALACWAARKTCPGGGAGEGGYWKVGPGTMPLPGWPGGGTPGGGTPAGGAGRPGRADLRPDPTPRMSPRVQCSPDELRHVRARRQFDGSSAYSVIG